MRIERLFNVLVLGGAALGAGCSSKADEPARSPAAEGGGAASAASGAAGEAVAGANDGGSGAAGAGASEPQAGGSDAGGAGTESGAGGAAGAGGASSQAGAGGSPLVCSETPSPSDACGCPCCWVGNCANTEPCCASFCSAGDDGNGCCGS